MARSSFADSFAYFRFNAEQRGEELELIRWWEHYIGGQPMTPEGELLTAKDNNRGTGLSKQARRRRRRRKAAAPHKPLES
jgi:hypothetical protein